MSEFGHHCLYNRFLFEGSLKLSTALKISSGRASDDTDAPFMRMLDGTLYMPGSSLRGAVRSEVERILSAVGSVAGLKSCILFESDNCESKTKEYLSKIEGEDSKTKDLLLFDFANKKLCDVCKLFGSTIYASRLIFEDAIPTSVGARTCVRDGVGIDRDTGAARKGVKFDYEVVEKNQNFTFRMRAENIITTKDKRIIDLIQFILRDGIYVGGKRSGGLGRILLEKPWNITGFMEPQSLWKAINEGKGAYNTVNWEEVAKC